MEEAIMSTAFPACPKDTNFNSSSLQGGVIDELKVHVSNDVDDISIHNQVVGRSNVGTAFYLFNHQAGGHKPFLRSASGEVCKPAIPLELQFYNSLDAKYPQLKRFVPPFVGVITVDLHPVSPTTSINVKGAIEVENESTSENESYSQTSGANESHGKSLLGKKRRLINGLWHTHSPVASYSVKLWKKERLKGLKKNSITRSGSGATLNNASTSIAQQDYLVLGDLTHKYCRPCVLDIKMGTRQHGEDAPPEKVKSHSAKCTATTSSTLGLRFCGMQIFHEEEQKYTLWDKHWGRALQDQDIKPALETYLSNGTSIRWDALKALQKKVEELELVVCRTPCEILFASSFLDHDEIRNTKGLRFWGSSLLLIYEGDFNRGTPREDVHLIDFAHCQQNEAIDSADEGLLLGLSNISKFLNSILACKQQGSSGSTSNF